MALVPIGMANQNVAMYEANNPLIEFVIDGGPAVIPDSGNSREYKLIPAAVAPAGGGPNPSWWVEIAPVFIDVANPGGLTDVRIILAPSTAAANGTEVPEPVVDPATMKVYTGIFSPGTYKVNDVWYLGMGSATVTPNPPQTAYSLFISIVRGPADPAVYTLNAIAGTRKDIS